MCWRLNGLIYDSGSLPLKLKVNVHLWICQRLADHSLLRQLCKKEQPLFLFQKHNLSDKNKWRNRKSSNSTSTNSSLNPNSFLLDHGKRPVPGKGNKVKQHRAKIFGSWIKYEKCRACVQSGKKSVLTWHQQPIWQPLVRTLAGELPRYISSWGQTSELATKECLCSLYNFLSDVNCSISRVWASMTMNKIFPALRSLLDTVHGRHILGWDIHKKPNDKWATSCKWFEKGVGNIIRTDASGARFSTMNAVFRCPWGHQLSTNSPISSKRHSDCTLKPGSQQVTPEQELTLSALIRIDTGYTWVFCGPSDGM